MTENANTAESQKKRKYTFRLNPNKEERKRCLPYFLAALILLVGVYASELFHFVEDALFSWIYSGNLNEMFFAIISMLYISGFMIVFHVYAKRFLKASPFFINEQKTDWKRLIIIFVMTALPIIAVAAVMGFKFKLEYGLGERVTGMTLLGNGIMYVNAASKLFAAVYFIYLIERACHKLFEESGYIPFGGILLALTFGVLDAVLSPSAFGLLNAFLCLYYGVVYLVAEERFGVTFTVALLLYII